MARGVLPRDKAASARGRQAGGEKVRGLFPWRRVPGLVKVNRLVFGERRGGGLGVWAGPDEPAARRRAARVLSGGAGAGFLVYPEVREEWRGRAVEESCRRDECRRWDV